MGRPPTRAKRLKDGFYIEVRSKGATAGMKIRSEDEQAMQDSAAFYLRNGKEVVVLGEHKNDIWVNEDPNSERNKKSRAARRSSKARKEPQQVRIRGRAPKKAEPEKKAPAAKKPAAPKKAATAKKAAKKAATPKKKKK
jgi:hypothetical protein